MAPKISSDLCTGCGVCIESCPLEILELANDKCVLSTPDECTDCQSCIATCATEAIQF